MRVRNCLKKVALTLLGEKQQKHLTIHSNHHYIHRFIDTSKSSAGRLRVAFVVPELKVKIAKRVSGEMSVHTGEMLAIWLALQWVEEIKSLKTIICSDSIIIRHCTVQSHRKQKGYPHEKTASSVQSSGDGSRSGVYVGTSKQWSSRE